MTARWLSRALLSGLALAATTAARVAHADPPPAPAVDVDEACMASYTGAQRSRLHAQLRLARKQLMACLHPSCAQVLRKDCAAWLDEVEALVPSLVVTAHDASGKPVTDVRVSVDGEVVAESISAVPVGVDPGAHTLRFDRPGALPVERAVVLRETEKAVPIVVAFEADRPAPAPPAPPTPTRRFPPLAIGLGAAGAAAFATGVTFEAVGLSQRSNLDACRGHCTTAAVNDARDLVAVGDVATGVGLSAIAASLYVAFLRPRPQAHDTSQGGPTDGRVQLQVTPLVGGLAVRATF